MEKGTYVVHWSGKVCRLDDISVLDFTGTKREYLILSPVRDSAEKIYVPVEKQKEVLRPVLSKQEAEALIAKVKDIEPLPIKDEKQRAQEYKTAFYSQNYVNLVKIAKDLYQRREERSRIGKALPSKDAQMMAMVEKTFEEEMAIALGIEKTEVRKLLESAQ